MDNNWDIMFFIEEHRTVILIISIILLIPLVIGWAFWGEEDLAWGLAWILDAVWILILFKHPRG